MRYSRPALLLLPLLMIVCSFSLPQIRFSPGGELPATYNDLFAGSGTCQMCHNSQVNQAGESISIVADWRSSMMANAARDPFWRAKVSHEGLVNPGHKEALEDVCTRCHAPTGNVNAHHNGQPLYSIAEMQADPLALDGVQCSVCHQIQEGGLGNFSGTFEIGDQKIIYGPYMDPFTMPMINNIGYTPEYSAHINDSRVCGSCHTLITNSVDNNMQPTGNQFVEQSIYQEWKNSSYPANNIQCSSCHIPRIDETIKISSMPPWLEGRSPFGMHHFQGANVLMSTIMKENGEELGVTASSEQYDKTIARNVESLQEDAVELSIEEIARSLDTLFMEVEIINKSGHKLPAGYPSRRFFVEMTVKDVDDIIIFHSGAMDENFQLIHEDASYESHYNVISSEEQVQIYEMVMGDIDHTVTTVLERANFHLKDNRIPPLGFTSSHNAYDTIQIVGQAETDPDFNKLSGVEGNGRDKLHFHIPVNGYSGQLKIAVKLHYQTVSSRWLENMFSYSSDEIDAFQAYYIEADKTPVLMAADSSISTYTMQKEYIMQSVSIFPNPATSVLNIRFESEPGPLTIQIVDIHGREMDSFQTESQKIQIGLSKYSDGIYHVFIDDGKRKVSRKFVKK